MIEKIIDGISNKLFSSFDDVEIYADSTVKQGLNEPCFFIAGLEVSQKRYIGNRWFRNYPFVISYFSDKKDKLIDCNKMGDKLLSVLEYIELQDGSLLQATGMSYNVIDDVLHFNLSYGTFVHKEKDTSKMDNMHYSQGVKV